MYNKLNEWKAKRKKALIAVCTLGLSEAPWGVLFNSSKDADKDMSFGGTIFGFIFNCVWFLFWTVLSSAVIWVINIVKLLNYHISIKQYEKKI